MEFFTPCDISAIPPAELVDTEGMASNLFKNTPAPVPAEEKLQAFLRIRPVNDNHQSKRHFIPTGSTLLTKPPEKSHAFKNKGGNYVREFNFNKIFDETSSQDEFYERCALPMAVRALKGESSLLFAYGTTNSGKSFTMRGNSAEPGVIPRALNTIFTCLRDRIDSLPVYKSSRFDEADQMNLYSAEEEMHFRHFISSCAQNKTQSMLSFRNISMSADATQNILEESHLSTPSNSRTRFSIWVSFVEFYMENVKDLLAVDTGERPPQLMLVPDGNNNYFVRGLRRVSVSSAEEAFHCLLYGWENLHRAATNLNKDSSRSHCIFTISLVGYEDPKCGGKLRQVSNLSFCDLAGSERGDRTHNKGDRLKEAGKINQSLSVLGRCISAIRTNQRKKSNKLVVPFRDSTLTKYFQSYFNGTGMASMIININPSVSYYDETMVTLQFSAEASDVTVSNDETKRRLKESFNRLTQQWMHSSSRWSAIGKQRSELSEMTLMTTTEEEDEESVDMTHFTEEISEMEASILDTDDPEQMNELIQQIDLLHERLKACENEKFEMETQIRMQVWDELNEKHKKIKEEERNRRVESENDLRQKISDLRRTHRQEIRDQQIVIKSFEDKVNELEKQLKLQEERYRKDLEEKTQLIPHQDDRDSEVEDKVAAAVVSVKQEMQSQIHSLKSSLDVKTEENDNLRHELQSMVQSLNSKDQQLAKLEDEKDILVNKNQELNSQKSRLEDTVEELQASLQESKSKEEELQQVLISKDNALLSKSQEVETLLQKLRDQEEEISRITCTQEKSTEENEHRLKELQALLSQEKGRVVELSKEMALNTQAYKDSKDQLSSENEAMANEVTRLRQDVSCFQENMDRFKVQIEDWKQKYSLKEAELLECKERLNHFEEEKKNVIVRLDKSTTASTEDFFAKKNDVPDSETSNNHLTADVRISSLIMFSPLKEQVANTQETAVTNVTNELLKQSISYSSMEGTSSQESNGNTSMRTTRLRKKLNESTSSQVTYKPKASSSPSLTGAAGETSRLSQEKPLDIRVKNACKRKASTVEPKESVENAYIKRFAKVSRSFRLIIITALFTCC